MIDVLIEKYFRCIGRFIGSCVRCERARRSMLHQRFEVSGDMDKSRSKEARIPFGDDGLNLLSTLR